MSTKTIKRETNYGMFKRDCNNRRVSERSHRQLYESMKNRGFLAEYPIVCFRDRTGRLVVKDGHHRLRFAEMLGLPVYYTETQATYDVAEIDVTHEEWTVDDYAHRWADGDNDYAVVLNFAEHHNLKTAGAAGLLGGKRGYRKIKGQFVKGEFEIADYHLADEAACLYNRLVKVKPELKTAYLLEACSAMCRTPGFNPDRMIKSAKTCKSTLDRQPSLVKYLDMFEEAYNFSLCSAHLDVIFSEYPSRGKSLAVVFWRQTEQV